MQANDKRRGIVQANDKPIRIVNRQAIRLAKKRAELEGRSAANAASVTIIEALGPRRPKHNFRDDIAEKGTQSQGENRKEL
jgi:hypothetical protein